MKFNFDKLPKLLLLVLVGLAMGNFAYAQRTITGLVTDDTGEPLIGANVSVVGTSAGTVTDIDGTYSLRVPDGGQQILFSYTGYADQTIDIGSSNVINATMAEGEVLEELVVIGYGTAKQKEVTGAITSVKEEDFNKGNITNPVELLQGKVAGLTIARPGGNPNAGFGIRLRGLGSIGANSQPLIVIDGVPGGELNSVDPNDIASIDVLKDASAAAIYGTRGGAGVILITTKTGKSGASTIDYNGFVGFSGVDRTVEVMDAAMYRQFAMDQDGVDINDLGGETNWFDELTRTGISQVHNLSLGGGNENGTTLYRASVNYRDVQGIALNTGFDQLNGRVNFTQRAFDNRLTLTAQLTSTTRNQDLGFDEAFRYATIYNPTAPIFGADLADPGTTDYDGLYDGYYQAVLFDYFNPVAILEQNINEGRENVQAVNARASFDLTDDLNIGTFFSRQRRSAENRQYFDKQSFFVGRDRNGLANQSTFSEVSDLFEATLRYNLDVSGNDLELLGGYSYQQFDARGFNTSGGDILTDALTFNSGGALADFPNGRGSVGSFQAENRLVAFFGRARLNVDDTYFVTASLRREGSSRFGADNQYGWFPGVSAGVALTNLVDIPSVDNLKLRVAYGQAGNNVGSDNRFRFLFGPTGQNFFFNGEYVPSYGPTQNPNPELKWEVKEDINVGLDFNLFDYKLNGSLEYYNTTTNDLILPFLVPQPPNFANTTVINIGDLRNSGVELNLTYNAVNNENFTWTPSFNASTFSTELRSLSEGDFQFGGTRQVSNLGAPGQNQTPLILIEEGAEVGQIYGLEYGGIDDNGEWIFVDQNNDGNIIDEEDRVVVGNGLPDFQLGLANTFTFGNWDATIFFRGVFGHDLVNTFRAFYEAPGAASSYNILASTAENAPDLRANAKFSDFHVEAADFVKLDNMQIGYTFPLNESTDFRNVKLYVSGQNLFTITGYSGVDPEVRFTDGDAGDLGALAPGIDRRNTYFRARAVQIGVNVGF